jgi:hypothetical protein
MRLRKIALALFACLALTAVAANAAQANWTYTEGTTVKTLTGAEKEKIKCAKHGTEPLTLAFTVGTQSITMAAEGVDCEEAFINTGEGMNLDHSEGFLNFTNVKVTSFEKCKVRGGNLTTKQITAQVFMDENVSGSTRVFDRFFPETGTTFIEITFEGAECPINELTFPITGSFCGEAVHTSGASVVASKTGEHFVNNILSFGMEQQTTGNSTTFPCALKAGTKAATISGTIQNELAGTHTGAAWGADRSVDDLLGVLGGQYRSDQARRRAGSALSRGD